MTGTAAPRLQRADGALVLGFDGDAAGRNRLADLYQHDPCRALLPRPDPGEPLTAVLVTTSGGLTGGDRLRLQVTAGAGSAALCTPQAAEKIYRAEDAAPAALDLTLTVAAGAALEWLPQETILFDGARLRRQIRIALAAGDARLLAGDITVFGRIARGERFTGGLLADHWELRRAGRRQWVESQRLEGDIPAQLTHPAGFAGAVAQGLILCAAPEPDAARARLRALIEAEAIAGAGVTLLGDLLLVRLLDADAVRLRRHFALFWAALRPGLDRPAAMPRLWQL